MFCWTTNFWMKCRWDFSRNGINVINILKYGRKNNSTLVKSVGNVSDTRRTHTPVLVNDVADMIQPEKAKVLIDMTFGSGGHTRKLLERSKTVKIVCVDRDPLAYSYAKELEEEFPDQIKALHGKFSDLPMLLKNHGYRLNSIDGMLFDFGVSSVQFDDPERGFSYLLDGPLDMRMDGPHSNGITAADVLAYASEHDLQKIFKIYGEEMLGKKIARYIIETRYKYRPLKKTNELRELIASILDRDFHFDASAKYTHSAKRVFLGLRMFVNNEINEINYAIMLAGKYLKNGGILVTLCFHAIEDMLVKRHIDGHVFENVATQLPLKYYNCNAYFEKDSLPELKSFWKPINKHVITPNRYEQSVNPRSHSVKLRACIKVL